MITVRSAIENDHDAVLALAKRFTTSFAVEEAAFRASFAQLLADPNASLRVAEGAPGQVVGYVLGFDHDTFYANGRVAWVEEIMVAEDYRRQGVGRLLMDDFEAWARNRRCRLVGLATRRAAPFYRAIGYEESATYFRKRL